MYLDRYFAWKRRLLRKIGTHVIFYKFFPFLWQHDDTESKEQYWFGSNPIADPLSHSSNNSKPSASQAVLHRSEQVIMRRRRGEKDQWEGCDRISHSSCKSISSKDDFVSVPRYSWWLLQQFVQLPTVHICNNNFIPVTFQREWKYAIERSYFFDWQAIRTVAIFPSFRSFPSHVND